MNNICHRKMTLSLKLDNQKYTVALRLISFPLLIVYGLYSSFCPKVDGDCQRQTYGGGRPGGGRGGQYLLEEIFSEIGKFLYMY